MLVSIVICAYDIKRFSDLVDAINSLCMQTYPEIEIICIVDGTSDLYYLIKQHKTDHFQNVKFFLNDKNVGLSESRNRGVSQSTGDIIAFFDDDAVADKNWVNELVKMYVDYDAIASGGKLVPMWVDGKANFIPEEFYWMLGATYKGFPDEITEVRNTFGSNISFKKEILNKFDGFKGEMGLKGSGFLQGEETEICERMRLIFGKGVMYNPEAIVHHKVYSYRMKLKFLIRRAFWQGYSKRMMAEMGYSGDVESSYLKNLLIEGIGGRIKNIGNMGLLAIVQIIFLFLFTFTVFAGYIYRLLMPKGESF